MKPDLFETLVLFIILSIALVAFCTSINDLLIQALRWIRRLWIESDPTRKE